MVLDDLILLSSFMSKKFAAIALTALTLATPLTSFAKEKDHKSEQPGRGVLQQVQKVAVRQNMDIRVSLNGKVTSIIGSMITLLATNGSTYTIDAQGAKLDRRFGGDMVLGDIQVNDQLSVAGSLMGSTVHAKTIRDNSLQARNGDFVGSVKSVSGSSFVLTSRNRGDQMININASTTVMRGKEKVSFSALTVDMEVNVHGVWDRANSNVTATKIEIPVKNLEARLNGTISAVNTSASSTLTLAATDGKTYEVNVQKAQLIARNYFGNDFTKVRVGDTIQVVGKTETASMKLNAQLIVDFSL